jgi:hypothetical protein
MASAAPSRPPRTIPIPPRARPPAQRRPNAPPGHRAHSAVPTAWVWLERPISTPPALAPPTPARTARASHSPSHSPRRAPRIQHSPRRANRPPSPPSHPAAPRIELLLLMRVLDPPGIGLTRPPQPAPPILPTAPPIAPARAPQPALARRARKRAPAPASQPAAPRIELLLLMRVLDPPGIGDIRPPQPAPPIPPAALPTAPARAPQPALAHRTRDRTRAPASPTRRAPDRARPAHG